MRLAAICGVLLLLVVPSAGAVATHAYSVGADNEARGWPRSLRIVFASPAEYEHYTADDNSGEWIGPEYWASRLRTLGGRSSMGWFVDVRDDASAEAALAASWVHAWPETERGAEVVERVVAGSPAPGIPGGWIVHKANYQSNLAQYEAALAFSLCGRIAVVRFSTLSPSGDSAGGSMGFGEYYVKGSEKPSAWNRAKIGEAITLIRLEGSLPAARLTAVRRGRNVAGRATDCQGVAVAATRVTLERKAGRRWVRVRTGTTTATGAYSLRTGRAGTYRAVVGAKRSAAVRVR